MAGFFTWLWDYLLWLFWATEMDVTIVGLQNAGKTSLLRVLAVRSLALLTAHSQSIPIVKTSLPDLSLRAKTLHRIPSQQSHLTDASSKRVMSVSQLGI